MPVLVLNTINRCNADCLYCFVDRKGKVKRMDIEYIGSLYRSINQFLLEELEQSIEIQWHGGEPLLLGPAFFDEIYKIQNNTCADTKDRIRHSIQSNLTLLNQKYINVFEKLGLTSVGTSCELIGNIRLLKKKSDRFLYSAKFLKALRLLDKDPFVIGINYVVTKKSLLNPQHVFYYLSNILPRGIISYNPVITATSAIEYLEITPYEFNSFLQYLFKLWFRNKKHYTSMEPFYTLYEIGESLNRGESIGRKDELPIMLNPDGEYYHFKRPSDILGNSESESIPEIIENIQLMNKRIFQSMESKRNCLSCRLLDWCKGNLNMDSYSQNDSLEDDSNWCEARKDMVFNFILNKKYKET